jgi:RNA polymerase sigma factor (sigma-70 family)
MNVKLAAATLGEHPLNERCRTLLVRIRQRDEAALAEFYDVTLGKSYGLAMRITGNAADAEDAVAETYIQVWADADRYDESRGRPLAWLLNMCRSRALDCLRRRDCAVTHPEPDMLRREIDASVMPHSGEPLPEILASLESADLHRAMAELPATSRQLLGFAFFRGMTHREIVNVTGLPLGTVKSHLRRAIEALRTALDP